MFRHTKCQPQGVCYFLLKLIMNVLNLARTNELPEDDTSCVETCRNSLFVISTIIVTDIHVHSLV